MRQTQISAELDTSLLSKLPEYATTCDRSHPVLCPLPRGVASFSLKKWVRWLELFWDAHEAMEAPVWVVLVTNLLQTKIG
jgi:hypothetical protein